MVSDAPFALLFPGQGTEAVGMSTGWDGHPDWREVVARAETRSGFDLEAWMREGPESELRAPRQAPYAVVAHSVGLFRAHRAAGMPLPRVATGHSLGFYSAVVAAGVVPLEAVLELVDAVEDASAQAFGPGTHGMAFVIGLSERELREALEGQPDLALSNLNGRAQFTVSGPRPALETLLEAVQGRALKCGLLPVQHPLHGPHMVPLVPSLARRLAAWKPRDPEFPLLSHATGALLTTGAACWDEALVSVALPVCWVPVASAVRAQVEAAFECGHGAQLANLTRWAERTLAVKSLQDPAALAAWGAAG
ncbi:MAG: Malonyl CoA-acyl carrier protein transacylase [Acidobacteria bacterium ADurb.Bin340]|nr:MAG: Malonyl CoA-acyl carrier protein transacylase [Acidobacteria bacterium ADurb.Bin340]